MNALLNQSTETGRGDKRTFHVAFCVDNHYFRSMGATITSLIAHNPATHFVFHVFAFAVAEEHRARLSALEKKFDVETRIHIIDPTVFRDFARFTESSYYSPAIFSRLLIPTVLRDVTDRVLYLDADILCVGSIAELMDTDIADVVAAVVPDAEATARRRCAALGLDYPHYFNSGVMYMNVGLWMANRITEQTVDALLKDGKDYRFPDQDALNVVLAGRARFIDKKWNCLYGLVGDLENDRRELRLPGETALVHFAGAVKPWSNWTLHESRELFARHHAMSAWADLPLDEAPKNYKEMRMHSRFLWRRKQVAQSLYWYWRYTRAKFRF
jgi:UDP-glucose:(glucosyl)LPS alpha-1,3-glucosyltransferase